MDIMTIISIVVSAVAVIIVIACDICIAVNYKKLKKAERKVNYSPSKR
jgi:Mg2+/citrate symporter